MASDTSRSTFALPSMSTSDTGSGGGKTAIKIQQSEERLYRRLAGIQKKRGDRRSLVLAYGSWGHGGRQSGRRMQSRQPPCIGSGLMRKLSRRFVVSPTPEAYTSKNLRPLPKPLRAMGGEGGGDEKKRFVDYGVANDETVCFP